MWRVLASSTAIILLLSSGSAQGGASGPPTLIYSSSVNDQPSTRSSFARMQNGGGLGGVYYDPTVGANVSLPGIDSFFGNDPVTLSGGFSGPTVQDWAEMSTAPRDLHATILNQAWAGPANHAFVNTSSSARTWFVLKGARKPVSLRADIAFQGAIFGDAAPGGSDASAFFTHALSAISHPTCLVSETIIGINGRAQPAGTPCGPWGLHGTVPDQCFDSDGSQHAVNYVIRSNPFLVLPDLPFRLALGLNAAADVNAAGPDALFAFSDFRDPGLATSGAFPGVAGLTPDGFVVDRDGNPATRDVVTLSSLGYFIQPLPDSATVISVSETAFSQSMQAETVVARTGQLSAPVSGDVSGTIDLSSLAFVGVTTGSFAGKGFFTADWQATLGGVARRGSLRGFSYESTADDRVYLKGVVSGGIDALSEGYLTETTPGSGVYDRLEMTWALSEVAGVPAGGRISMSGTVSLQTSVKSGSVQLQMNQLSASGTTTTDGITRPLDLVVSSVRIASDRHAYVGQGFAVLSYQSADGAGEAWAFAYVAAPGVVALGGLASGPLGGLLYVVLDESVSPKAVVGLGRRTDLGLPPMPDVEVSSWSWGELSPGETFNYGISYDNRGLTNADNVVVMDRLPQLVEYVSSSAGGAYDPTTHLVTFNLGSLPPGQRGTLYVTGRVRSGVIFANSVTNQVLVGTDNQELNVYLAPETTAFTPGWWDLQIARAGNDWDARLTPPGFDPAKPEWQGLQPDSLKRRVEQAIQQAKQHDPAWGEYLQNLYDQGKIHIDLDIPLNSSQWNGAVGHMYLSGQDIGWGANRALQVSDQQWNEEAMAGARVPNLAGVMTHEGRHSDGQLIPGSQKGEMQAFSAEGVFHLKLLYALVDGGRYADARALLDHMDYRWKDLGTRNNNWIEANGLSLSTRAKLTDILLSINLGDRAQALKKILAALDSLLAIAQGRSEPIGNGTAQTTSLWGAWDPNGKSGPEGPVTRGQTLQYRIEYENVGKGKAFGVYVTDALPAALDEATLTVGPMHSKKDGSLVAPAGSFNAATRTITWLVGEVGPGAGGYADVTAQVTSDAPDGSEIINYATIYFPSVPQVTPTNPVVSIVTPPGLALAPVIAPARLWVGLKNSDDQGTNFDLRAELYADDRLIAQGETLCVMDVTRNATKAKPVVVPLDAEGTEPVFPGTVLSLKVLARIGTTPDGQRCEPGSHASAVGLRLYYDALQWASQVGFRVESDSFQGLYLRSTSGVPTLDSVTPTGKTAKTADSEALKFSGGNPWQEVGAWTRVQP